MWSSFSSSVVISLRHAYQNTVLAAANRAEVLHGLCCQLITPLRRHPARRGASFSRAAWLGGSNAPVTAIRAPAVPASPLISSGKRPVDGPLPLPRQRSASSWPQDLWQYFRFWCRFFQCKSSKTSGRRRWLSHHVSTLAFFTFINSVYLCWARQNVYYLSINPIKRWSQKERKWHFP